MATQIVDQRRLDNYALYDRRLAWLKREYRARFWKRKWGMCLWCQRRRPLNQVRYFIYTSVQPRKCYPCREARIRRAQEMRGKATITGWRRKVIRAALGDKCLGCGTKEKLTLDHVIPVMRGGSKEASNFQLLCMGCNFTKGNRSDDYRKPEIAKRLKRLAAAFN